jgi:hypothetical protein
MDMLFSRRGALAGAAALLPVLGAGRLLAADAEPISGPKLLDAWRRMFTLGGDAPFAWWLSGTLSAHVDGPREFPVVGVHAIMACRAKSDPAGVLTVDWHTIGFFSDLENGGPTAQWDNLFTGRREKLPDGFAYGPGRYVAKTSGDDLSLSLTEENTKVTRTILTGEIADGRVSLTQNEGRLQGFPRGDGALPPADASDITAVQTRFSFIGPAAGLSAVTGIMPGDGFFAQVYDSLPDWLGFGDSQGGASNTGVMKKADPGNIVDQAVWSRLNARFPEYFAGNRLKSP